MAKRKTPSAKSFNRLQEELKLLKQTLEDVSRGIIVLNPARRVRHMSLRARQYLTKYFADSQGVSDRIPDSLSRWVQREQVQLAEINVLLPRVPLEVEREGERLLVWLLPGDDHSVLILEEQETVLGPMSLQRLGLTSRESEVLTWVVRGKTNHDVGSILGISSRTVQKHLEHIFQKLGVETRTAAAAQAFQIPTGGLPRSIPAHAGNLID